jgi:hypothetical protein
MGLSDTINTELRTKAKTFESKIIYMKRIKISMRRLGVIYIMLFLFARNFNLPECTVYKHEEKGTHDNGRHS